MFDILRVCVGWATVLVGTDSTHSVYLIYGDEHQVEDLQEELTINLDELKWTHA